MTVHAYELDLPWDRPPLSLNQRLHHFERARKVAQVRQAGWALAKARHLRPHGQPAWPHVTVSLHYRPATRVVIDADNQVATLKALADGLVDAGVVQDDAPEFMTKNMPVIHPPKKPGRLWLVVEIHTEPKEASAS